MPALLLPLLLLALWILRRRTGDSVLALIQALLIWGALIVGVTEILSLFRALTPIIDVTVWGGLTLAAWASILLTRGMAMPHERLSINPWTRAGWIGTALVLLVIVLVAISSPPNNWDVAIYHGPRIFYWEQFHTIAPFPTHTDRQLYQPPFAEYVMLHLQILSGGDRLANLAQATAMGSSGIIVAYIASLFGVSARGQLTAAVFCVTIPEGIMQATGSKNDLITGLWVLCATALVLRSIQNQCDSAKPNGIDVENDMMIRDRINFHIRDTADIELMAAEGPVSGKLRSPSKTMQHPAAPPWDALQIGLAAGLALLTKGTAYIYLAPLLLWYVYHKMRFGRMCFIPAGLGVGLMILAVNGPHFSRNVGVYGSPLTPASHRIYFANEIFTPAVLISNTIRNIALHICIPYQVNRVVNVTGAIEGAVGSLHDDMGLDVDDPRTTFPLNKFALPHIREIFNEDRAGSPLHLLLILGALTTIPFGRRRPTFLRGYALVVVVGFLLFSGLLKWQVWGTRLQLPWFLLAAPLVGHALDRVPHLVNGAINGILLLVSVFWLGNINNRPIFASTARHPLSVTFYLGNYNIHYTSILNTPRDEQYFAFKSELYPPSQEAADQLAAMGCAQIGIIGDENTPFYPIMMLIRNKLPSAYFQSVGVTQESRALSGRAPFSTFSPGAVLLQFGAQPLLTETPIIDGINYRRAWANKSYEIYLPVESTP